MKGWHGESIRHSLASRGIATRFHQIGGIEDSSYYKSILKDSDNISRLNFRGSPVDKIDFVIEYDGYKNRKEMSTIYFSPEEDTIVSVLRFPEVSSEYETEMLGILRDMKKEYPYFNEIKIEFKKFEVSTMMPHLAAFNVKIPPNQIDNFMYKIVEVVDEVEEEYQKLKEESR